MATRRKSTSSSSTADASTASRKSTARRRATAATLLPLALGIAATQLPSGKTTTTTTTATATATAISISCTLPFEDIKVHHPIDDSCTSDGKAKAGTPQAAQNEAKNNFCATGTPVDVNFEVLRQLQQEAASKVPFGSDSHLPPDRSQLKSFSTPVGTIGEGAVVRLAAFVIAAHYSNVGAGESVNCKLPDKESNDIHIVLGEKTNHDDECSSATAEMSPHFRPSTWVPESLTDNNAHLFRFTGQLFFDASHHPCTSSSSPNPKRSSLWEIHPVYAVDICLDPANNCTVDKDEGWVSLSDHIGTETQLHWPELVNLAPRSSSKLGTDRSGNWIADWQ